MTKVNAAPVEFFRTPEDMAEIEDFITRAKDPMVTTAAMMMYNLLVSKYDLYKKETNND